MEYRRRRPSLYRLARYLRWASVLALIVVILFLASTFYSAFEFATHGKVSIPKNGAYVFNESAAGGLIAGFEINITNPGLYPLVLDLSAVVDTAQGPLVPYTTTGAVTIAPGNRTTSFGLTIHIPTATLESNAARMLVNDTPFSGEVWFNGTYAWIYQFGFNISANGTWGAPLNNLSVQPGTPSATGGQTTVPVTISFIDSASFADVGNLTFQVVDGGANCGAPVTVSLNTSSHQRFDSQVNLTGPSSCMVPGATVMATYSLGSLTISLPAEKVP